MMSRTLTTAAALTGICLCAVRFISAAEPTAADTNPNLLLITLDTVRADHLSCNGTKKVRTPQLDRLARGGVNFTRARTSVPLTLPAHASIMTGNYPPVHGVRDNGSYRLPEEQLTLAEVLDGHGYETAPRSSAPSFSIATSASRKDSTSTTRAIGAISIDWRTWPRSAAPTQCAMPFRVGSRAAPREGRSSPGSTSTTPTHPWIHLYDPHAPYVPPEPFRKRYADDPYAGEIAYTDAVVGKIVEDLESRKLLGSTLVAVVGDHGEALGEHGEQTHSLLIYNSTIHVPMLLHFPGLVPPGKTVDHLTRTIDLAPTILDYPGISQTIGQGTSLRPLVEGGSPDEEILAYSESLYPSLNLGWSELRGLEAGGHRFILAPSTISPRTPGNERTASIRIQRWAIGSSAAWLR